ncbi:MAG TPA: carboxypeptidase regulatory-like domain-containing protein [Bryobacteraceae bacterium]|nr:carboxypeptidase regulatory-like domain-containing protein [Bryobacteraceae bacterium]
MQTLRIASILALSCAALFAQATSQIQGTVHDESGSAVPGAEVRAIQTATGVQRTATTSTEGGYVLPNLPIGPYRLEVSKAGFTTFVQTGITLQVATNPTIDVQLKVGAVTEQVQVAANAALVDTEATSVGSVIENQRIVELPLNGRNPVELIQLAGAAVPGGRNGTAGYPGGLNISIAGGMLSGVTYSLDGTLYNNPFDAMNLPFPFPDALQEFKVETNSLTAQNGMHAAGAVSAVVKSGTNQYHGDLFEFLRNGDMNARNFFAPRRDTLKRNQYGGTLGGPVLKNKLFFFVGYQGTRTRSDPANLTGFVPTASMLQGNFSGCGFPQLKDPSTGAPFPGNQIPASMFSAQSLAIVKQLPTSTDPCGKVPYGPVTKTNEYQVLGRVDYQISERQTLFGRYMASAYYLPPAYAFSKNILDTVQGGLDDLAQTAAVGHTFLFSPTSINTFSFAANRVAVHRFNDDYFSACDLGVAFTCFVPHQTVVNVTGGPSIGIGTAIQASFIPMYYTLADDVSLVRGSHQIKFGYSGFKYQHSQLANVFSAGTFGFTGLASGAGMSDFLLGELGSLTQGTPNSTFTYKWYHSLYLQDTWKISSRLTANLGIRWEPFLPQGINNGAVYNFNWANFYQGIHSTVFSKAPAGLVYAGDPGFQGKTGVGNRWGQFGPRVGIAFDPRGDGKTVIRASGGIFYDFPNIQIMSTPTTAPPFGNTVQPPGPLNFANPWATVAGGNPFTTPFGPNSPFVNFGSFMAQQPDAKGTTVYTWNLAVQRQVASWLLSVTYLGTQTRHLWVSEQLNPAILVPGPLTCAKGQVTGCNSTTNTNQRRLAYLADPANGQYLGFVDQFESGGTASYNGMILSAEKRLTRGVSIDANYTWSHCIGDSTIGSLVGGVGAGLLDPNNRAFDRGNCQTGTLDGTQSLDRRHIVNITAVLQSPRFEDRILRIIASNWVLSPSYRFLSGAYLTAYTGVDRQLSGTSGADQRPNQVLADPLCSDPRPSCWINPAAFAQPALGTLGSSGRSSIPGPGFWDISAALSRIFTVHEGMTLEARGEAFNLTNSFRAGAPGQPIVTTTLTSNQFGQILSAQDPRIMQVALKFVF